MSTTLKKEIVQSRGNPREKAIQASQKTAYVRERALSVAHKVEVAVWCKYMVFGFKHLPPPSLRSLKSPHVFTENSSCHAPTVTHTPLTKKRANWSLLIVLACRLRWGHSSDSNWTMRTKIPVNGETSVLPTPISWSVFVVCFRVSEPDVKAVMCDDTYECPDGDTCCKWPGGRWGCCPLPQVRGHGVTIIIEATVCIYTSI